MLHEGAYLVAETLRGDDGDFVTYSLVGLEIEGEFGIVAFDNDFGRLFDGLMGESCQSSSEFSEQHMAMGVPLSERDPSRRAVVACARDDQH